MNIYDKAHELAAAIKESGPGSSTRSHPAAVPVLADTHGQPRVSASSSAVRLGSQATLRDPQRNVFQGSSHLYHQNGPS